MEREQIVTNTFRSLPRDVILVAAISAAAAVPRLLFLGKESLWMDEGATVYFAQDCWTFVRPDMPLYYFLLHFWLFFGKSEFMLRLPSAVLSVATVPALYSLGKRLFCSRVGIVAALLFAVHAVDIQYAQEARSYSLVIFLVTLSSLYFLRSIERPSLGNLVGYTLISVLSVYAHLFAALVLATHWVFLFFLRPDDAPWPRFVASGIATSLLSAPAMLLALAASGYWAQGIHKTSVKRLIDVFYALAGSLPRDSRITGKWLLLFYSIAVVAAFITFGRAWFRSERKTEASYGFLVSGLCIPVGLALTASFFRPLAEPRYFLVLLPVFVLLASAGIFQLRSPWVFLGVQVVFLGFGLLEDFAYHLYFHKPQDYGGAVRYVLSNARPGDAIVMSSADRPAFEYYSERLGGTPEQSALFIPPWDPQDWRCDVRVAPSAPRFDPGWLDSLCSRHQRVWLIPWRRHRRHKELEEVWGSLEQSLAHRYKSIRSYKFQRLEVSLYSPVPAEKLAFSPAAGFTYWRLAQQSSGCSYSK